jgi:hypothetical protein
MPRLLPVISVIRGDMLRLQQVVLLCVVGIESLKNDFGVHDDDCGWFLWRLGGVKRGN